MSNSESDRQERRFAEMLRTVDAGAAEPNETFLAKLKDESTEVFRAATLERPAQERKKMMKLVKRYIPAAAAAVIVVGIAVAALLTVANGGASSAWAAVQEKVRNARTLSCKVTQRKKGAPDFKIDVMALGDGRVRQEMVIMGHAITHIMDMNKGKILILDASDKQAVQISVPSLSKQMAKLRESDWMTRLKKLIEGPHSELEEKMIAGTKAKGYQVSKDGQEITLRVDADTGDILEMTIEMFEGDAQVILSDFELDKELDESLFSFEIPEGYELAPTGAIDIREATDEDIVAFLKFWADARGDTFPDTLTEAEWFKDCMKQVAGMEKDVSAKELKKWAEQMGSARMFLQMHPETAAQYAGKGVKLGEADKIVLWYKRSKDDESYTGIYGDLSIKTDLTSEDLPQEEPSKEATVDSRPAAK